jgi:hypothetical protein
MVAYSFQKQFVAPILAGTKTHTVRADRKRHARPGEELQLYSGMRTQHCKLIMRARCIDVKPIVIVPKRGLGAFVTIGREFPGITPDDFARSDGFRCWADLCDFWDKHHPGVDEFSGVIIFWSSPAPPRWVPPSIMVP